MKSITDILRPSGWNDYLSRHGVAVKNLTTPTPIEFDGFGLSSFIMGDEFSYEYHVQHQYKLNTKVFPHIHWSALTPNPDISEVIQFDVSISVGKAFSQAEFTTPVNFSLVASPTGFNFNETMDTTEIQGILPTLGLEPDTLIRLSITRVTPVEGVSYSGIVHVGSVDLHYESDETLTTDRFLPFTKV